MKVIKIIGKVLFWIVIGLLGLMIAAGIALQTRPVKNKIASVAESQLNRILEAEVKIGRIEGDFFTNIYLKDISLKQNDGKDTLAIVPEIKLSYRLLPLLQGTISVKSAVLEQPYFSLVQYPDSTWNVQKIVRPSENPDTVSGPFTMVIDAQDVRINDGTIHVSSFIKEIPRRINHFYVDMGLDYSGEKQGVVMREMKFVAQEPDLVLKKLTFNVNRDSTLIRLEDFMLKTAENQIKANIRYYPKFTDKSTVDVQTTPIHLEEIQAFLPKLKLKPNPKITLKSEFDTLGAKLNLELIDKTQRLKANLKAQNLIQKFIQNKDVKMTYNADAEMVNIDLRDWLNNPEMKYIINGNLNAKGEGIDPKTMAANIRGNLNNSVVLNNKLNKANFDFTLVRQRLTGYLNAAGNFGTLDVKPIVDELFADNPRYNLTVNTRRLNLAQLANNRELKSNINFNGVIRGVGFNPNTLSAAVNGRFTNSAMFNQRVDLLNLNLSLIRQRLTGALNGRGDFGALSIRPTVNGLFSKVPNYTIVLNTQNLNLAKILKDNQLASDINLDGTFTGAGFDPNTMRLNADMRLRNSSAQGVKIDTLYTRFLFANNNINIHELVAKTATISLNAQGVYSLKGNSDLTLDATIKDGTEISRFANLKQFYTEGGTIRGRLFGKNPKIGADLTLNLDSTRFEGTSFGSLNGNALVHLGGKSPTVDGKFDITNFKNGDFYFDTVQLTAQSAGENVTDLTLKADGKEIKTQLSTSLDLAKNETKIGLSDFKLDYKGQAWKLDTPLALVTIGKESYTVRDMRLVSGAGDSIQVIYVDGVISRTGMQNLQLKIENVDVGKLAELANVNQTINGNLYLDAMLAGTAQAPLMNGEYKITNASVNEYAFPRFDGTMDYADRKLGLVTTIVPQDSGRVSLDGHVPFKMAFDSMQFKLYDDREMQVKLLLEKIPLAIIKTLQPIEEARGVANADISVAGTIRNPKPTGLARIENGALRWKRYGIDYRTILAHIDFEPDKIMVDTFLIRSRDGYMSAQGNAGFRSQFYQGDFRNSKIDVKFDRFQPFNHRLFNIQMTGNANLQGVRDSLVFNGDITVPQSLFYLPAVMDLFGKRTAPEIPRPLLIAELEKRNMTPDSIIFTLPRDTVTQPGLSFNLFSSLQGRMKVNIPRNTWIKNEQLRVELMGDLDVYKYRNYMELFGTVDVVRGQYEMLGKTFIVKTGNLVFEGGKEINPRLNVEASYTVRTPDRAKRDLRVLATGTLQKPELNFTLDGETLSEGDAVAYILFGMNMDQLAAGQNMGGGDITAEGLAGTAVASLLSSQLTKVLGNTLNVDYIEFRTAGTFDQASFVVGKYITNNLFMSYERRFGNFKDDSLSEYELRLEYELFRFLFLQLTSSPLSNGIDAIIKWNTK